MTKKIDRKLPTGRKAWGKDVNPNALGDLLKAERTKRETPQHVVAKALAKAVGGKPTNVRISAVELGKMLPDDKMLAFFSKLYGLALPSLRAKRDELAAQRAAKAAENRAKAGQDHSARLAEKRAAKLGAKHERSNGRAPSPVLPAPVGPPVLADWIDLIDGVVPMPSDKEARKRWLGCAMELFKIGNGQ